MSNLSIGHSISPSASIESQDSHHRNVEATYPESGWSDSDQSDSLTKSWVVKGSKMLKKQNSKFNLSSSKRSSLVEELDEASEQYPSLHPRGNSKHGRMWSTSSGLPVRPTISKPFHFRHLTHTQPHQFADLHSTSQQSLETEFSAIRASQAPQKELQGIRTEDLRSPTSDSSFPRYMNLVTPPSLSPTKFRTSRPNSGLSINAPGRLSHSRSVDNFSQPSPKTYRTPQSPTTPPARTSSRHASLSPPEFFSDIHHATPSEREILSQCSASAACSGPVQSSLEPTIQCQPEHVFHDENLPHALTTSDQIALTLKPSTVRRSALALADVPEEAELHSIKRVSDQSFRPVATDSTLRHATSFPSNSCSPSRNHGLLSHKSLRLSGVMPIQNLTFGESVMQPENVNDVDAPMRMSTDVNAIDACWEDDIDYCYQHEAEADCDFDWDRVSMDRTLTMDDSHSVQPSVNAYREGAEPLAKAYEKLNSPHEMADAISAHNVDSYHLPQLQTSLPDLDFSATSSAKSSIASLRGPITPLHQPPSPRKVKPFLRSKSTDTLDLESSFITSHDCEFPWPQEDPFKKTASWDHAINFNYPFNNLSLSGPSKSTSLRSSRPPLSTYHSSESILLSNSASAVQTRRNTNFGNGLPTSVCSKNYRQQADIVAEQIAHRMAALAVTDASLNTDDDTGSAKLHSRMSKDVTNASAFLKDSISLDHRNSHGQEGDGVPAMPRSDRAPDEALSVASFANRLRSNSAASKTPQNDLLSLRWPLPPQNILLVQKRNAPVATEALKEFAQYIHDTYPNINVLLEPDTANGLHESIPFPVYTHLDTREAAADQTALTQKVDLAATFGGDGTILRASSLFSKALSVPPILSFSMGTLGFLGEWKFAEFKRAFREVYMSGAGAGDRNQVLEPDSASSVTAAQFEATQSATPLAKTGPGGWSSIRGKSLGKTRGARVLLRNRLKVAVDLAETKAVTSAWSTNELPVIHAMNEIIIHRGATPHLAHIAIYIGGRFLTEAVADGMIISTPTGSTAYSLSSGGSIIHPLVDSLCLTPICPRSLSFRPLVLPANTPIRLRLSEENNRGREVEVSIDGVRQKQGLRVGGEIRVVGEVIRRGEDGWSGGVPCVMRGGGERGEDDGWVGGLNGLLKFNYPFGEEG
ncbi:MAG: hypothetical protein Q9225_002478 [Loekoesia sp. 1 TL-2023]